jgi:ribosomal protein S18 acetylase RimI-like enzyme
MANRHKTKFSIRTATAQDIAVIAAMTQQLLQYETELSRSTNTVNSWAATEDEIRKQFNATNTRFFLAECEGKILAYLKAVIVGKELNSAQLSFSRKLRSKIEKIAKRVMIFLLRLPRPTMQVQTGVISGVFVLPEARGQGTGKALAETAEKWFAENGLVTSELQVLHGNEAAQHLWEELGYEPLALGMRKKIG